MDIAWLVAEQVLVMFLLIGCGFICAKAGIIDELGSSRMNKLLLYVVIPFVIVDSFNREFDPQILLNMGICALLLVLAYSLALGLGFLFVRGDSEIKRVERLCVLFPNSGFMGIPLIAAVVGGQGVIYATVAVIVFNVTQWTIGRMILIPGGAKTMDLKKIFLNPGVIGCALGLLLFFLPITLPRPLEKTVSYVASLNTPLAMILIGSFIARAPFLSILRSKDSYIVSALRLVVIPALLLPVFLLLPKVSSDVVNAVYIGALCPVAAACSIFPAVLGLKAGEKHASALIAISTLLSIITIPLMMLLKSALGM